MSRVLLTIPPPMPVDDSDLIDDVANDLRRAWDSTSGLARYPVSDPVWTDMARKAIERVRAAS